MKLQCEDLWTKGQHLEDQILSIELVELVLWEANRLCWKGLCHSHFQKCRDQCQDQCQDAQDHEKTPSQRPMGGGGGQNSKTNVKANVKTPMEALGQSLSALTRIWTRRLSGKSLSSCGAPRSDRRLLRSRARARSPSFVSAQSTAGRAPHRLARSRSRAHPSHAPRRMRLPPGCAQPTTLIRSGSVRLAPLVRSIQRVTGTCRAG